MNRTGKEALHECDGRTFKDLKVIGQQKRERLWNICLSFTFIGVTIVNNISISGV